MSAAPVAGLVERAPSEKQAAHAREGLWNFSPSTPPSPSTAETGPLAVSRTEKRKKKSRNGNNQPEENTTASEQGHLIDSLPLSSAATHTAAAGLRSQKATTRSSLYKTRCGSTVKARAHTSGPPPPLPLPSLAAAITVESGGLVGCGADGRGPGIGRAVAGRATRKTEGEGRTERGGGPQLRNSGRRGIQ